MSRPRRRDRHRGSQAGRRDRVAERLWAKDGALWAASGKPPTRSPRWLGWLDLPDVMAAASAELEHLARDVREDGYRRAAVLGMGGSSLAPELFSRVFGVRRRRSSCASSTRPIPTPFAASARGPPSSGRSSS